MSTDANDFLFGGGGKAAKFEELGAKVTGTITEAKMSQQTSMENNTPLTWDDGSPRMQLVISLQTDERVDDEDDGIRRLYAKGGNFEVKDGSGKSMKDAIADAIKAAGAKSIDEGARLTIAYTGNAKPKVRGHQPAKLFKAKYEAPKSSVPAEDLFDD